MTNHIVVFAVTLGAINALLLIGLIVWYHFILRSNGRTREVRA